MLEKFPNYIQNVVEEHPYSILKELQKKKQKTKKTKKNRQDYKQRGRP